jgi:hypothetical protein
MPDKKLLGIFFDLTSTKANICVFIIEHLLVSRSKTKTDNADKFYGIRFAHYLI